MAPYYDDFGAYAADNDPKVVFVFDRRSKPPLSAIRREGKWRRAKMSIGELEHNYRAIDDGSAAALVKAARMSLSD